MKNIVSTLMILSVILLLISCTKDDDPVSGEQKSWFVVDTLGNPISGAKIVASYYREVFDSTGVLATLQPVDKYTPFPIVLSNPETGHVYLIAKNYYTKDTVRVFINDTIPAGLFVDISWNRKNSDNEYVLNGVYEIEQAFNDTISMSNYQMVCYNYDGVEENELEYIAETDTDGRFDFDPLEQIYDYEGDYDVGGLTGNVRFTDYIKLWAVKDGYENACIDSLDLLGKNEVIEIILIEEDDIITEGK